MKYITNVVVLAGIAVLCSTSSWAGIQAGKSEFRLDGALQNTSTEFSDSSSLSAQLVFNQFLADQFSIGLAVRPTVQTSSSDGGEDTTSALVFLVGRGDLYLASGESTVVPYAGAHAGVISTKSETEGSESPSESVFTYGAQGGLKIFASENTSFNIELDVSVYTPEDAEDDSADVTVTSVLFGYSVYF